MLKKCNNSGCNFNENPEDATYCAGCGNKIRTYDSYNEKQNTPDRVYVSDRYAQQYSEINSYPNFLKRNWWFIALGLLKAVSGNYEMTDSPVGDILAACFILFGIMTVYWFFRYKVFKI